MNKSLEARITDLEQQVQAILKQLALLQPLIDKAECDQAIATIQTVLGAQ